MKNLDWDSLDWDVLERLRTIFLSEDVSHRPQTSYWSSRSDLANYDYTFAQRIAWKWDAVLRELSWRGWTPPSAAVLDWGCGSGIAGRRVIEFFGLKNFRALFLHDRSELAVDFACEAAQKAFPTLDVKRADARLLSGEIPVGLLVVSHVLTELDERERSRLLRIARGAQVIMWVEPGALRPSRELISLVREPLRTEFNIIAPCTHQSACGLLAPEKARHWCHNFADPPAGIMRDSNWVRFSKRAGIDLRSLPYSFLIMEKHGVQRELLSVAGCSRIIGRPRYYKAYALVTSCQHSGVRDLTLRKRDVPTLFKALKDCGGRLVYRWHLCEERIVGAERPEERI